MDGWNPFRTARVAEILDDFRTLQYYIASSPTEPSHPDDYHTEGWAALRQCAIDGQYILDCAADTSVPTSRGGEDEQRKAELKQVLLDAYARRHQGQKIYLRQGAAQRWIEQRDQILQGERPRSKHSRQLRQCDQQLRSVMSNQETQHLVNSTRLTVGAIQELSLLTDEYVYEELQTTDVSMGRWIGEDPSLRKVVRWLSSRLR